MIFILKIIGDDGIKNLLLSRLAKTLLYNIEYIANKYVIMDYDYSSPFRTV